jgi:urease accessory protein
MDSLPAPAIAGTPDRGGWEAHLDLGFERDGERSVLARRVHAGPLRVQKALYPEGRDVCQAIIVHPPGGIVGGDRLALDVAVGPGSRAQVTTPGAAKWYRSAGDPSSLRTRLTLAAGAVLEWLPLETLVFDGAVAAIDTRIELGRGARFIGWDVVALGRTASGERFERGCYRQSVELHQDGELAWCERAVLRGGSPALQSGAILADAPVFGTMIAAGAEIDDGLVAACRAIADERGQCAVTRLAQVLVARVRGDSAIEARMHLATMWAALRPAFLGRAAVPPRLWST